MPGGVWPPVAEGNCVPVKEGGEQPEAKDQSVAMANSIRPVAVVSLLANGETQDAWPARARRVTTRPAVSPVWKSQTAHRDGRGWLETEWSEGATKQAGRPVHVKASRLEE